MPEELASKLARIITDNVCDPPSECFRVKKSESCPATFWCSLNSDKSELTIRIHKPDCSLGVGAVKDVRYAVDLFFPRMQCAQTARFRPHNKFKDWEPNVQEGFDAHARIYKALSHLGRKLSLTMPPRPQFEEPLPPRKRKLYTEYVQQYYPYDLWVRRPESFGTVEIIRGFANLFDTLHAMHLIGEVHGDVKDLNILMSPLLFPLRLSDFDFATYKFHGKKADYSIWDKATQAGLVNPYGDIVGAAIALFATLFPETTKELNVYKDLTHSFLKGDNALTELCKRPEIQKCPHAKAILELIIKVVSAEDRIYSEIVSSVMYLDIDRYTFSRLAFLPFDVDSLDEAYNYFYDLGLKEEDFTPLHKAIDALKPEDQKKMRDILYDYALLRDLFIDEFPLAEEPNIDLFSQLISESLEERLKGFAYLGSIAPSALDISQELNSLVK
jgi:serine/threonine protein kinase